MAGTRSIVLGLLLLAADVAHAEDTTHALVAGAGQKSCGQLIAAIGKLPPGKYETMTSRRGVFVSEYAQYLEWLGGFVSALNHALVMRDQREKQLKIDSAGMELWMRNWCHKHPTKTVFYGATVFVEEMQGDAAAGR